MKVLYMFLFSFSSFLFSQTKYNLITSSSKTGKFITVKNITNNHTGVYNIEEEDLFISLEDITPISWVGNSSLIYYKKNEEKIEIWNYEILSKEKSVLSVFDANWFETNILQARAFSFPQFFLTKNDLLIYYINDNYLCKMSLVSGVVEPIVNTGMFIDENVDIHNISIDVYGNNLVFICSDNEWGYLKKYNLVNEKVLLLKKTKSLKDFDNYVYFMKNDRYLIFYKTSLNNTFEESITDIVKYDLVTFSNKKIGQIKNCKPSIFFDIPTDEAIILNVFCQNFNIELTDDSLNKIIKSIGKSFSVVKLYY